MSSDSTTPLQQAAKAVIDCWDSPRLLTVSECEELRKALDAEIAQVVEPFAYALVDKSGGVAFDCDSNSSCLSMHPGMGYASQYADGYRDLPLYLHPPQPQATTLVPASNWLIRKEPNTKDKYYVAEGNPPANVLEIYGITQGEKP